MTSSVPKTRSEFMLNLDKVYTAFKPENNHNNLQKSLEFLLSKKHNSLLITNITKTHKGQQMAMLIENNYIEFNVVGQNTKKQYGIDLDKGRWVLNNKPAQSFHREDFMTYFDQLLQDCEMNRAEVIEIEKFKN